MERNEGKKLMNLESYMSMINEEHYAYSQINRIGCVTDLGFQGIGVCVGDNKFRIMPPNEFNPLIYRGQNKYYPQLLPSSCRPMETFQHFLAWVRKIEFIDLFRSTPYFTGLTGFKEPFGCEFDYDLTAIAQHYEFDTPYLDFTKDAAIAMFFAYTKRLSSGQYVPIIDFEADDGYSPMLYIGNIKQIYSVMPNDFRVVGFQAALRPLLQQAICINASSKFGVNKEIFRAFSLPKSKEMAIGIYEHFKQGALLFPPKQADTLYHISEEVQKEQGQVIFSGYIKQFCDTHPEHGKEQLEQDMLKLGYAIDKNPLCFPDELIARMQRELDQHILPWLSKNVGYRGTAPSQ